jgi:hypothetical protein
MRVALYFLISVYVNAELNFNLKSNIVEKTLLNYNDEQYFSSFLVGDKKQALELGLSIT